MRSARIVTMAAATVLAAAATAQAAPHVSVSTHLQDRREVAAGQRAYSVGFENGRFYANGWHITGEMGGVWAPPLKLLDGIWFGVDGHWVGPARRFSTYRGYVRYKLPDTDGFTVRRTDFAPDSNRAVLYGLRLGNTSSSARTATITVDAHSELLAAYPWGFTTPSTADMNGPDAGSFTGSALQFTDTSSGNDYAALVGAAQTPTGGVAAGTGGKYYGPQPGTVCGSDSQAMPSACDDGPYGNGTGGELHYSVSVPAHGHTTFWVGVGGSDQGVSDAQAQLQAALHDPAGELAQKKAARNKLASYSRVRLPGDRLLQHAVSWGKQNLADLTQTADNLQIRWTDQGKQYPPPLGTVAHARWFGAGYPDYPWLFATDGEYTSFGAAALGQFEVAEDHLRALRDVSEVLNGDSGIVVHETVQNGAVYFGHDSQTNGTNDFNTDETIKFPSAVANLWRWTGDDHFRDEMYPFTVRNLRVVDEKLDVDRDGWPEGSGNVEVTGMGPEKLDNGVYYMRALYDLADMARSKGDTATQHWANHLANQLRRQFEGAWWMQSVSQYADSLKDPGNVKLFQKYWIGVVPMEAELTRHGTRTVAGVAQYDHGVAALVKRQTPCFSGVRPGNLGLFHTGCGGGGTGGTGGFPIFSLGNGIAAVGEGNYGRLGQHQQQRYNDANAEAMFSEPATNGTPDEQPGAIPEILPSTPNGDASKGTPPNIERCWTCRSMFMQAWGVYGPAWSVVHQQLGVRPYLGWGRVEVVPQVPPDQSRVAGKHIRLGYTGAIGVIATHVGNRYRTRVNAHRTPGTKLLVGHTLPRGAHIASVRFDGAPAHHYKVRRTNRGVEVTVATTPGARHTLVVRTA